MIPRSKSKQLAVVLAALSITTAALGAPSTGTAPAPIKAPVPPAAPAAPPEAAYVKLPPAPQASPQTLAAELAKVARSSRPVEADLTAAVELSVAAPVRAGVAGLELHRASVWVDVAGGTADAQLDGKPAGTTPPPFFDGTADARGVRNARARFFAVVGNAALRFNARAGAAYVVDCDVSDGPFEIDVEGRQRISASAASNRLVFAFVAAEAGLATVSLWSAGPDRWALRRCRITPQRS